MAHLNPAPNAVEGESSATLAHPPSGTATSTSANSTRTGLVLYPPGKVLDETVWTAYHNMPQVVTASEAATILGLNKYESALTLYHRKRGDLPEFTGNISTRAGHALENLIAELYAEATGRETYDPGEYTVYFHPDHDWLMATPDRFDSDKRCVELKALGSHTRADWSDKKGPIGYQVQNQIQLACTGCEKGSLAAVVATREFFHHDFDRHDKLLKKMMPKLAEFRERCMNGDPPEPDGSDSTADTLKYLHPKDTGEVIYDDSLKPYLKEHKSLKDQIAHLNRDKKTVANHIKAKMGGASEVWVDGQPVTWKWQHTKGGYRRAFDSRVLRVGK